MPNDPEPPQEGEPPEPETPEPPPPPGKDAAAEVQKWREQARKHESENKKLNKRLTDLEDRDKTELERQRDAAQSWQAKAEASELRALRAEVAARKGLTTSQAKRLQGVTEEQLEEDADELLTAFRPPENGDRGSELPPADRRPQPKLRPGSVPDAGAHETDPRKLAEQIRRNF